MLIATAAGDNYSLGSVPSLSCILCSM